MTIVDSCGWIEVFTEGPLSDRYWKLLKDLEQVVTPTIILYEVYKIIKRERTEEEALLAISLIKRTRVVPLNGHHRSIRGRCRPKAWPSDGGCDRLRNCPGAQL